jgi:putative transposase
MPSRNVIKPYLENSHYHIYNRGVAKLPIFHQDQDYKVLLSYLKEYLNPKNSLTNPAAPSRQHQNFHQQIELLAYCLMPNHFHFIVYQRSKTAISAFMRALFTRYTMYFNQQHHRVGGLFQGNYRGIIIDKDDYLIHLSKYIHLNPSSLGLDFAYYPFSSYQNYIGHVSQSWVNPKLILNYFSQTHPQVDYQSFVTEVTKKDHSTHLPHDSFVSFIN